MIFLLICFDDSEIYFETLQKFTKRVTNLGYVVAKFRITLENFPDD